MAVKQRLQPHEHGAVSEFLDLLERQLEGRVFQTLLFGSKARGDSTPDSDIDI
ncbi:MAG TPA: nucleotidyltransferase domain-containing protein, partial [Chloroflexi bacterium]|nr:nucleotidyltransferase domain-containing protein [Chloroflexota bacterium]